MFGIWENWEAMEAAYFCFVTISTIGFGDVVPGAAAGVVNKGDAGKMIVDGIYIVIGLAIISMAFNLIQVRILHVTSLATFLVVWSFSKVKK